MVETLNKEPPALRTSEEVMIHFESPEILKALDDIGTANYSAAAAVLAPLAQTGNPIAQCNLATLYQCGWGVEADGERAVELYTKAGEQRIREQCLSGVAYHNLATIYITGAPGVQPDWEKVQKYNDLAKEQVSMRSFRLR